MKPGSRALSQPASDAIATALISRQNPGAALGNAAGGGSSPNKALAIALGIGIPLILLLGAFIWWHRRRKARQRAGGMPKTQWGKVRKGAVPKIKSETPSASTLAPKEENHDDEEDIGVREKAQDSGQGAA